MGKGTSNDFSTELIQNTNILVTRGRGGCSWEFLVGYACMYPNPDTISDQNMHVIIDTHFRTWGPFLESPVNFSGPKSNIQIEIKRIRARVLAGKLLHFVFVN